MEVKNDSKESACNAGDLGLIPRSGISPEKVMATHSGIPAWKIPRTEEPGRLQSIGSQRVEHYTYSSFRPLCPQESTGLLFFQHYMVVNTNLFC